MSAVPHQNIPQQAAASFENFSSMNPFKNVFPANGPFLQGVQKMFPNNDVLINTVRIGLELQQAFFNALAQKTLESTEKLVDLNLSATKTSMEESNVLARQLLATTDLQEQASLVAALPQPTATKAVAYGRHLADIAFSAQAEVARATQAQITETGRRLSAMLEETSQNGPAGSEYAIGMMKNTLVNVVAVYEQIAKTTTQAAETIESQMHVAGNQVAQTAEQATKAANRARSK